MGGVVPARTGADMIVLGSYPIQSLLGRKSKDIDLLAPLPEFQKYVGGRPVILDANHAAYKDAYGQIYDCELIWPESESLELAELILRDENTKFDYEKTAAWVPSLNILYMLKMTHRFKKNSPHFLKTMHDIKKMRQAGAVIQPEHEEFYKKRLTSTLAYNHPNLKQTKTEFFNPEDDFYIYDHDSIHEAIAIGDRPAYVEYAIDGQEVLSSKDKFFNEVHEFIRLRGVYEEACVLALERSQIPHGFKPDRDWSFRKALEKVCTSITSGWFREYAWEHYDEVMAIYNTMTVRSNNYVDVFNHNQHKLRPYERNAA